MASEFQLRALQRVREILAEEDRDVGERLHRVLRLLANHRTALIANTLLAGGGNRVRTGPFAGMAVPPVATEGCTVPKLLGAYERELHAVIERVAYRDYRTVVNIGMAEGYYAVGLARRLPEAKILAYDTDPAAREATRALADRHGVGDRVEIGGAFSHGDFAGLDPGTTFLFCDIEGAEIDLLVPDKAPNLARLDMLVELHNLPETPIYRKFLGPFRATHRIEIIEPAARDIRDYPELRSLEHLDQLLAFWEWRRGPTPWLHMTAHRS